MTPFLTRLREAGCRVIAISYNVFNKDDPAQALRIYKSQERRPPIRDIGGAIVLQDSILEQMILGD